MRRSKRLRWDTAESPCLPAELLGTIDDDELCFLHWGSTVGVITWWERDKARILLINGPRWQERTLDAAFDQSNEEVLLACRGCDTRVRCLFLMGGDWRCHECHSLEWVPDKNLPHGWATVPVEVNVNMDKDARALVRRLGWKVHSHDKGNIYVTNGDAVLPMPNGRVHKYALKRIETQMRRADAAVANDAAEQQGEQMKNGKQDMQPLAPRTAVEVADLLKVTDATVYAAADPTKNPNHVMNKWAVLRFPYKEELRPDLKTQKFLYFCVPLRERGTYEQLIKEQLYAASKPDTPNDGQAETIVTLQKELDEALEAWENAEQHVKSLDEANQELEEKVATYEEERVDLQESLEDARRRFDEVSLELHELKQYASNTTTRVGPATELRDQVTITPNGFVKSVADVFMSAKAADGNVTIPLEDVFELQCVIMKALSNGH